MVKYSALALTCVVALTSSTANAFALMSTSRKAGTALNTFASPTLIIGPMIRRMREDQEKKKMPMASEQERAYEAPGLRVGTGSWKWPPVWPYDRTFFVRKDELAPQGNLDFASVAGMLSGAPQIPVADEVSDEEKFDFYKYWNEEKVNVSTEIDPAAAAALTK